MDIILSHTSALQAYRIDLAGIRDRLDTLAKTVPRELEKNSFRPHLSPSEAIDLSERHHLTLPVHSLSCGQSTRCGPTIHTHAVKQPAPHHQCFEIMQGMWVASPELMYLQMAESLDLINLVALGFELCGHYAQCGQPAGSGTTYNLNPLTTIADIQQFADRASGQFGIKKMRQALVYVCEGSRSPKETEAAIRLGMPFMYGAKNFGMPLMNHPVRLDEEASNIADGRTHLECNLYFPGLKLDVEYASQKRPCCQTPKSWQAEKNRTEALSHLGVSVVELTNRDLEDPARIDVMTFDLAKQSRIRQRPQCKNYQDRAAQLREKFSGVDDVSTTRNLAARG